MRILSAFWQWYSRHMQPRWDRHGDAAKYPVTIQVPMERLDHPGIDHTKDEVQKWCEENLIDRYMVEVVYPNLDDDDGFYRICFKNATDAIHFKMRWL